jgi:hypothetical protein
MTSAGPVPPGSPSSPSNLPTYSANNASDFVVDTALLVASGTTPPYKINVARDGYIYFLKGSALNNSNGGACGASSTFKGAAADTQPANAGTTLPGIMWGLNGNSIKSIVAAPPTPGGCPAGTDLDTFVAPPAPGARGCVMILPISSGTNASPSDSGTSSLTIQAYASFYVWCNKSGGSGCQEIVGQLWATNASFGSLPGTNVTVGFQSGLQGVRLGQ